MKRIQNFFFPLGSVNNWSVKKVCIFIMSIFFILITWMFDIMDISFDNLDQAYKVMKCFLMQIGEVDINNRPKNEYILAIKIRYLVIYCFYLIGLVITFVFTNFKFFLYTILVYIFVNCLLTDFFAKHFIVGGSWNINYKDIWKKRRNVISFIVKSWLLMLPIRLLIRGSIILLFNFHDNFISDIFIVLLALPFYYYFFNIIRKYLQGVQKPKTDEYSKNDYYLFNHYVIKQMNLYNIIYILCSIWIIKNYFEYCLILITIIFIITLEIVVYRYLFSAKGSENQLLSAGGPPLLTLTLASLIHNLGAYLSWSAGEAYNHPEILQNPQDRFNFVPEKETEKYTNCKINQVAASKFNTYKEIKPSIECFNWIHDNAEKEVKTAVWPSIDDLAIAAQISNSPILRMVYGQQEIVDKHPDFKRDVGSLSYKPLVLFKNERFIGSVVKVRHNLVINLLEIKNINSPSPKFFMPTHIVQDENLRYLNCHLEPIQLAIKFFEEKYGMVIPFKKDFHSIIVNTETKPFSANPSLEKFLRPYHLYSDLTTMYDSEASYYLSKKHDEWGPEINDLTKYGQIMILKFNAINRKFTPEFINENDKRLKELYMEYLNTRIRSFTRRHRNIVMNIEDVEPGFSDQRGFLFKKCASEDLKDLVFFKQDELPIFFNFKKSRLIDMSWTRRRLIEKMDNIQPHSSYYAISANSVSVELLSVENSTAFSVIKDSPEIYSIIDRSHTNKGGTYLTTKIPLPIQTFNILDKKDGQVIEKLLRHPNR